MAEPHSFQQKDFEQIGWVNTQSFLYYLLTEEQKTELAGSYSSMTLLPDTCLKVYAKDIFTPGLIGMGFALDPYSTAFNESFTTGLLPSPPAWTYPYRLDTLQMLGLYYLGTKGYNASSPDTLRIYVTSVAPYRGERDNYITVYMNGHQDTMYLIPKITVNGANQTKGATIVPTSSNTIAIDYILQPKDTVFTWDSAGETWYRWSLISLPLTYDGITSDGFEVPCGDVLSVMVHFIPGYEYELGDTLYWGKVNGEEWQDGYPIRVNNQFALRYSYLDNVDNEFADPFGFNTPLLVYREHRYQMFTGTAAFLNEYYYPGPNVNPTMYFKLSVNTDDSCQIDVSIPEISDIVAKIYPNPSTDNVTITLKNSDKAIIRLFNVLGQEVKSVVLNDLQTTFNVSDLNPGIYFVKIEQNGKAFTSKINIQ